MTSSGVRREQHLLTVGLLRLDDRYANLPLPGRILQLIATNLRNRPLGDADIPSLKETFMSLCHNLVTGSRNFPVISYRGSFRTRLLTTPFGDVESERKENTRLDPLLEAPPGILVPTAASSSSFFRTPVLPEKTELGALWADHRNCVRRMKFSSRTVIRVISWVFSSERTEKMNRWRVTDYGADGCLLMSVLCQFTKESAQCAYPQAGKRKDTEEDSSSSVSPPQKRMRWDGALIFTLMKFDLLQLLVSTFSLLGTCRTEVMPLK